MEKRTNLTFIVIVLVCIIFLTASVYALSAGLNVGVRVVEKFGIENDIEDVTTNIENLSIFINGSNNPDDWDFPYGEIVKIQFNSSEKNPVLEFEFNFTEVLNLSKVKLEQWENKSVGGFIASGLYLKQNKTKTIYLSKINNISRICILDKELETIENISDCREGKIINCNTFSNCSSINNKYKIEGLRHSGVREVLEGDVIHDCKVNIFDLAAVGLAYGSVPGDDNWNPDADLNNEEKVDIFDLARVGVNYNKKC